MSLSDERLIVAVEGRITDLEKKMARADAITSRTYNKMSRGAARSGLQVEKAMGQMATRTSSAMMTFSRGMAASLAAAVSAKEMAKAAATFTDLTNTLKVAGLEGQALNSTFRELFEIAQRNGTAIEPLVTLYSRLSQAQVELGASAEDLTRFTDGIALALRVGGTDATQASGALLQLSQAMGSAIVRAEEFNSINEGARPILQAVADGLAEAGGSVSKLRNLVLDGKLTNETFFRAFLAGMPPLEQKAAKATGTVSQGMTRVSNALISLVGQLDEASGASVNAATNLNRVASVIDGMPSVVAKAGGALKDLRGWLSEVGNMPVWRKIGTMLGVDYSPEGLAKATGYTPPTPKKRAGSSRRGGATMAPAPSVATVSLSGGGDTDAGSSRERVNEYERMTQAIRQRTDALHAETSAQASVNPLVDDYGAAIERARAEFDLLNAAEEAGIAITPELRAGIASLAGAYADASVAAGRLQESQDKVRQSAEDMASLGKDTLGGFISDLRNGTSAADSLTNALGRVADKLIEISLNSIFDSKGGGIAGLLSGVLGSASSLPGFAEGGEARGFAYGGQIGRSAFTVQERMR